MNEHVLPSLFTGRVGQFTGDAARGTWNICRVIVVSRAINRERGAAWHVRQKSGLRFIVEMIGLMV